MTLNTSITELNRVGKVLETHLKRLGIATVRDLLFYFPFRYEDYSRVVSIRDVPEGVDVTILGRIELIANKRSPRKRKIITEAVVADDTDRMRVIWFGQPFITKMLKVGDDVFLSGKVKKDMFGVQMVGPSYERNKKPAFSASWRIRTGKQETRLLRQLADTDGQARDKELYTTHTARIVPMYSLTGGVTQKQVRFLMSQVIGMAEGIEEWVPEEIRDQADVMPLGEAIRQIHFPDDAESLEHARRRMKFEELFVLQLRAEMMRRSLALAVAPNIPFREQEIKDFVSKLPYQLTKAQKVAAWEILKDLEKQEPMNRLLEGDVGSGKTVVAALVAYNAILAGYQVAVMAPTEVLAKQHFESFCSLLPQSKIGLLTSGDIRSCPSAGGFDMQAKTHKKRREEIKEKIQTGEMKIMIGTHALLTEDVVFRNLGLVIVDEQHRFGVEQRKQIRAHSGNQKITPHFLSMTATPIPRSLGLALYGDLDISIINEMPAGRKSVKTRVVEPKNREKAYGFIREQVRQERQVFVVCPLICDDNKKETRDKRQETNNLQSPITNHQSPVFNHQSSFDKKSVLAEYEKLSKQIFSDLRVAYLHGKMKVKEKDDIMQQFRHGSIDILVSTSVVEVGVDVPNASVMMIEGADRFGLAQLHQFRGRVGRAEHQSYCFLFTDSDSEKVTERLSFFEKNTDGFKVAEYDLEMRGPGEVYGTTQSGMMQLQFATMKDGALIKLAREIARGVDFEKFSGLRERVREWEGRVHLE